MSGWLTLSSHCQTPFVQLLTDLTKVVTMNAPLKFMGLMIAWSLIFLNIWGALMLSEEEVFLVSADTDLDLGVLSRDKHPAYPQST